MRKVFCMILLLTSFTARTQEARVIEYGYNVRGELGMIITGADTLQNFYDASGNRITRSQNIYAIPDETDPRGDHFLRCYPNPSGEELTVAFDLKNHTGYTITLYDQAGKFIRQMASENDAAGHIEVKFSMAPYPAGIYYIWFVSPMISKVKKVIRR